MSPRLTARVKAAAICFGYALALVAAVVLAPLGLVTLALAITVAVLVAVHADMRRDLDDAHQLIEELVLENGQLMQQVREAAEEQQPPVAGDPPPSLMDRVHRLIDADDKCCCTDEACDLEPQPAGQCNPMCGFCKDLADLENNLRQQP